MGSCIYKYDCTLSTDTDLAVGTVEHFYTYYCETIYVSVEEANGYPMNFGVSAGFDFLYIWIKILTLQKSTDQKPGSSF